MSTVGYSECSVRAGIRWPRGKALFTPILLFGAFVYLERKNHLIVLVIRSSIFVVYPYYFYTFSYSFCYFTFAIFDTVSIHGFFYKKHIYKKHEAEIRQKLNNV